MKRFLLLAVSVLIIACEKVETNIQTTESEIKTENLISQTEALDIVIKQLNLFNNNQTKSINFELHSIETINAPVSKAEIEVPLYLFNFKDNNGYALISADKRVDNRIYIISVDGNISKDMFFEESSPYHFLLKCIDNYQYNILTSCDSTIKTKASEDEETILTHVITGIEPLVTTKWYQGYPFNQTLREKKQFPINCNIGCAPVAIGQIIASFADVSRISYTNDNNVPMIFEMDNIRKIKTTYQGETNYNEGDRALMDHVADFLYYIAEAVDTDHYYDSSSNLYKGDTFESNMGPGIRRFGFTFSNFSEFNLTATLNSLTSSRPVLTNGWENNGNDAHTWVIDGYKNVVWQYRTYDGNGNPLENDMVNDYNYDVTYSYLHCNFGWENEKSNGDYTYSQVVNVFGWPTHTYVYSDIFKSTNRGIADNSATANSFDYTTVRTMCNIRYVGN